VTEAGRVFPNLSVLVGPLERDVEHRAFFRFIAPDAGADEAVTDFVGRLWVRCGSLRLVFHDVFDVSFG